MRILLLGRPGQVGFELVNSLCPLAEVIALGREEANLGDPLKIQQVVNQINPDVIVNAAAYTAVDKAETEEEYARIVNADSPAILAEWTARHGRWLIHYSTDYVFDGSHGPYHETDLASPVNAYGHTKLAGEEAIAACGGRYIILRTGWVYSHRGHNFLHTILRLAMERERLSVVDDQVGTPTWARTLASTTARILEQVLQAKVFANLSGLYHVVNRGATSWYGFAHLILEHTRHLRVHEPLLEPVSTAEYPSLTVRPKDSRLDTSKVIQTFGVKLPPWQEAVRMCLSETEKGDLYEEKNLGSQALMPKEA